MNQAKANQGNDFYKQNALSYYFEGYNLCKDKTQKREIVNFS